MMPTSTTLPITDNTIVRVLGTELHAGNEGEKVISSAVNVSWVRIPGLNDLDGSH